MKLNRIVTDPATHSDLPPVILLHGFLGSARNLGLLARHLTDRRVVQVDMRNHGASPWSDAHDYPAMAADLAELVEDEGGIADLVGHSMGGKAAMALALTRPEMVRRLVVLDIAPIGYGHSQAELVQTLLDLDLRAITRRSEADAALAGAIDNDATRGFVLQSLDFTSQPPRWVVNLRALLAADDVVTGWPAELDRPRFDGPVLTLAGGESNYVGPEGEAALHRLFPQADLRRIPGRTHWLHAEAPGAVNEAVAAFLA